MNHCGPRFGFNDCIIVEGAHEAVWFVLFFQGGREDEMVQGKDKRES